MLTFEDFFKKKKIDLQQLQQAEPALFAEFSKHYPLMGEKSFDHTKKYWFNILRRTYPLAQEPKPHAVQAEAISATAVQAVAVAAAQNLNEAIERPKFKEDNLPDLVAENVPEEDVSLAEEEKLITESNIKTEVTAAKPAFKPRFNAKNLKPEVESAVENQEPNSKTEPETLEPEPTAEPAKPAFKPRFNMQNIKKEPVKTASDAEVEKPVPEIPTENQEAATEQKTAYKPRFQMKNVKATVQPEEAVKSAEPEINAAEESMTSQLQKPDENKEAKPVYKPRFQMKNIPKPAAENPPPATEE